MLFIVNGETHWMSIANYSREDIVQWMELLKTQYHNGPDYRLLKLWHTDFPSIQGPWTPFTFKEPSLNQIQFPNVNIEFFCYIMSLLLHFYNYIYYISYLFLEKSWGMY